MLDFEMSGSFCATIHSLKSFPVENAKKTLMFKR